MKNSVWNAFVKYDEGADGGPGFAHRTTGTVLPLTEVVPQPLVKPSTFLGKDSRDAAYLEYPADTAEPGAGLRAGVREGAGVRDRAWDMGGAGGRSEYAGASEYQGGDDYGGMNGSAGDAGGGGAASGFEGLSDEVGVGVGVWSFGWVWRGLGWVFACVVVCVLALTQGGWSVSVGVRDRMGVRIGVVVAVGRVVDACAAVPFLPAACTSLARLYLGPVGQSWPQGTGSVDERLYLGPVGQSWPRGVKGQ